MKNLFFRLFKFWSSVEQDRGNKGNKLEQPLLVGWVDPQNAPVPFLIAS